MSLVELSEQVRDQPIATLRRRTGGIERHSNIESVVAASFTLLPAKEREMLCVLGIFVGSFSILDAAFVFQMSEPELLARLSDLRDHSLVQIQQGDARTRYKVLDTVRDYLSHVPLDARFALELRDCKRRHAEHYADLAVEIGRLVAEGRWSAGTTAMMRDIGNLRVAISTAAEMKRYDLIGAMVSGLARRFFEAGLASDFRALAAAGYEAASQTENDSIRIQLLGLEGAQASREGDEDRCESIWMERVELCRKWKDIQNGADALIDLAWQAFERNQPKKSRLRLIEALRLCRPEKDPLFIATVRVVQARIAFASANIRLARLRSAQAEQLLPQFEDRSGSLFIYQLLAISCRELDDQERRLGFTRKLLQLGIERNQVVHAGWSLLELAQIYEQTNQFELAARCHAGAMKVHTEYATRHRSRATTGYNQFKRKHETPEIAPLFASFRSKSWLEIAIGIA
jgi:hypothetical protein